MLYNFDIGSGGKSPQNVNNFNDAYNSDTFLAGCELKGPIQSAAKLGGGAVQLPPPVCVSG